MQAAQTPYDATNALPLIACIVIWAISPAKWATFKKMAVAFLACNAMVIVIGLLFQMTAYTLVYAAGKLSVIVAALMGWQHIRSLKKKAQPSSASKTPSP
jgi:cytochrome b subunit of formate dehydrogenase